MVAAFLACTASVSLLGLKIGSFVKVRASITWLASDIHWVTTSKSLVPLCGTHISCLLTLEEFHMLQWLRVGVSSGPLAGRIAQHWSMGQIPSPLPQHTGLGTRSIWSGTHMASGAACITDPRTTRVNTMCSAHPRAGTSCSAVWPGWALCGARCPPRLVWDSCQKYPMIIQHRLRMAEVDTMFGAHGAGPACTMPPVGLLRCRGSTGTRGEPTWAGFGLQPIFSTALV